MNAATRMILGSLFVVCLARASWADGSNTATTSTCNEGMKVGRGFANQITCPFEFARTLSYDVADHAIPGILTGLGKGAMFGAARLWGGFMDVVSLGCCPERLDMYQRLGLKDFVWQEQWWPTRNEPIK